METGRTKPDKDVFLGTADIIAQVKLAQARPGWRWLSAIRLYVVALFSLIAALFLLVSYWRALPTIRRSNSNPQALSPSVPSESAAEAASGAGRLPPTQPLQPLPIKVVLSHASGAIWMDGTKVADKKRVWSGNLPPGNHQLAVRVGGHMMRHTFVVESEGLHIALDPVRQSFVVSSAGKGHRAARQRGF